MTRMNQRAARFSARRQPLRTRSASIMVALGLTFVLRLASPALADAIRLHRSAVVYGPDASIRLKDVARVTGVEALKAREVEIIPAAGVHVGDEVEITIAEVRQTLLKHHINLGRIAMSGDRCRVIIALPGAAEPDRDDADAGAQGEDESSRLPGVWAIDVLEEATLRGQVARTLIDQVFDRDPSSVRITFSDADRDELDLSTASHDFEVIPQATSSSPQIPVHVRVFQGDRFVRSIRVVVHVLLRQEVYIAQRYISRGDAIRPGDFAREIRIIEPHPIVPEEIETKLEGQEARGRIVRGEILRTGQIVDPIVIRRNQEVRLICKIGAFVVEQQVRALESGRTGDVISVRPLKQKTELKARIEPEGMLTLIR